jgi:hypothetical protein
VPLTEARKEGALYFLPMGKQVQLAEVILGSLCSIDPAEVAEVVDHHHPDVATFQSRLAYKTFSIVPKEATVQRWAPPRWAMFRSAHRRFTI